MERRGFSLIELLVVIAIIGLLTALLLPTLAGAHRRAREVKCLGNCQQLVLCLQMYADANKTWYPMVPVPAALPTLDNQSMYGGLAGFLSLDQQGDGTHTGFTGGQYSNGLREPILAGYLSSFGALTCPSDKEDRYYGFPYSTAGNMSYASAIPLSPSACGREEDIVSYRISYVYFPGAWSGRPLVLIGDECNGPDLDRYIWYGDGSSPAGGTTPNSLAAGSPASGDNAPVDNHGTGGGNFAGIDGGARFVKRPRISRLGYSVD